jgi:hypothetical protein
VAFINKKIREFMYICLYIHITFQCKKIGTPIAQYPLDAEIAITLALSGWSHLVLQVGGYYNWPTPHSVEKMS